MFSIQPCIFLGYEKRSAVNYDTIQEDQDLEPSCDCSAWNSKVKQGRNKDKVRLIKVKKLCEYKTDKRHPYEPLDSEKSLENEAVDVQVIVELNFLRIMSLETYI